jgi:tRNA 2-selenouridine synthase
VPLQNRVDFLVKEYGAVDISALLESTEKIRKRLGGQSYKQVIESIHKGELDIAAEILLGYYDKAYRHGLEKREPHTIFTYETTETDYLKMAEALLKFAMNIPLKLTINA